MVLINTKSFRVRPPILQAVPEPASATASGERDVPWLVLAPVTGVLLGLAAVLVARHRRAGRTVPRRT